MRISYILNKPGLSKTVLARTAFAAAGLIMVTVCATACSSGSTSAAAGPQSSAVAAASSAATGGGSGSSTKKIAVCADLTPAEASQITGTKFTTAKPNSVDGEVFGCNYGGPDSALLEISVDTEDGKGAMAADVNALKAVGHAPNSVSGVGDAAYSMPNPNGNAGAVGADSVACYGAVFGSIYISIGGLTYVNPAQGKAIVEQLDARL